MLRKVETVDGTKALQAKIRIKSIRIRKVETRKVEFGI